MDCGSDRYWILAPSPQVTLFAPGYKWEATVVTPPDGQEFVDSTVAQMRRLKTREERLKYIGRIPPGGVPHAKVTELIRAIDRERAALGLGTTR